VLFKDQIIFLTNCDKFSFLPMPSTEYEVRIHDENSAGSFRIRAVGEINENLEAGTIPTSMSQIFGREQNVPDTTERNETDQTTSSDPPQNERKRAGEETKNESPAKRGRTEISEASTSTTIIPQISIKSDPDSTTVRHNPSTSIAIKPDPDAVKIEPPTRPSCEFGIRCYRNTPDHRRNFAHPADSDYRRPSFPDAPPGTSPCP
jgi:PBZ domain